MSRSFHKVATDSEAELRVVFGGILNVHRDRAGFLPIYSLERIILDAMESEDKLIDFNRLCGPNTGRLAFHVRQKYNMNLEIYREMAKHTLIGNTVEVYVRLLSFGITSWVNHITVKIRNERMTGILGVKEERVVLIDEKSRRPTPFPEWFNEKYKQFKNAPIASGISERKKLLIPSVNAFKTSVIARHSDCDINFHVGAMVYYKLCHDVATEAALSGYYRHFKSDMCWFPVLEMEITYLGESKACDEIDIVTWQDVENVGKLYFSFFVKGKNIFQAYTVFDTRKYDTFQNKL